MHSFNLAYTYNGEKGLYALRGCFSFLGGLNTTGLEKMHYKPPTLDRGSVNERYIQALEEFGVNNVVKYENPRMRTAVARYNSGMWVDCRKFSSLVIVGSLQMYRGLDTDREWMRHVVALLDAGIPAKIALTVPLLFRFVGIKETSVINRWTGESSNYGYSLFTMFNKERVKLRKNEVALAYAKIPKDKTYVGVYERMGKPEKKCKRFKTDFSSIKGSTAWCNKKQSEFYRGLLQKEDKAHFIGPNKHEHLSFKYCEKAARGEL